MVHIHWSCTQCVHVHVRNQWVSMCEELYSELAGGGGVSRMLFITESWPLVLRRGFCDGKEYEGVECAQSSRDEHP